MRATTSRMIERFSCDAVMSRKAQLIRAFPVVGLGDFNGVAGVAQVKKLYSLDDAAGVYIQAGNDALC